MRFDVLAAEFGPRNPIRTTFAGCASVRQTDSKIALAKAMAKIILVTALVILTRQLSDSLRPETDGYNKGREA
jgi:hypothetical protein